MRFCSIPAVLAVSMTCAMLPASLGAQGARWKAHDPARPKPSIVTPGTAAGAPPSDAIVLFDGTDLRHWSGPGGAPPKWTLRDGYMETAPGGGPLITRRGLGDMQLHLEWATPSPPRGKGQDRGNSGVIIMGKYEVQVLDSHGSDTYADGQAGALYGQHPPLVNASLPAGTWQSYDIIFRRPRFDAAGKLVTPARATVLHNGVVVQDGATFWGGTSWLQFAPYEAHADSLPLVLQDHAHPVRYRNIWARPLPDLPTDEAGLAESRPALRMSAEALDALTGSYGRQGSPVATITRRDDRLLLALRGFNRELELVPETATRFAFRHTVGTAEFAPGADRAMSLTLDVAEQHFTLVRLQR